MTAEFKHIRVFLASPGDVTREREIVRRIVRDLNRLTEINNAGYRVDVVAWDEPGGSPAMPAHLTPQEAIRRGLPEPKDCDLTIVILWSRMGTPLPFPEYKKLDDTPYLSGTEWEFWNAFDVAKSDDGAHTLYVYRNTSRFEVDSKDPERDEKLRQADTVDEFFKSFRDESGAIRLSVNEYAQTRIFETLLRKHLSDFVWSHINRSRSLRVGSHESGEGITSTTTSGVVSTPTMPIPDGFTPRNPYKGLRAFREDDRRDFFGRKSAVDAMIACLRDDPRLLCLIGPSGSGKSSLVMAELLPRLKTGEGLSGSSAWVYLEPIVPGRYPLEALVTALAKQLPERTSTSIVEELLEPTARGLHDIARQITSERLVVYIDQFEELFMQAVPEDKRRQFLDLVTTAISDSESVVTIVLTLRADFYDRPLQYAEFGQLVEEHHITLMPLEAAELQEIVLGPASQDDVRIQFDIGLVDEMISEVRDVPVALPLLQFTLHQLFERRDGVLLTRSAYQDIGGVLGALARAAERTFHSLGDGEQALARSLFLRLIDPGFTEQETTRRRARMAELDLSDASLRGRMNVVMSAFVQVRLLTVSGVGDNRTIEVSHEALIFRWKRLTAWVREERQDVLLMQRLSSDAGEWERQGRSREYLYSGNRLRDARAWAARNAPSSLEEEFLRMGDLSQRESQRRRRRGRQFALTGIFIVILLFLLYSIGSQQRFISELEAEQSRAYALRAAAQSQLELRNGDSETAVLLAKWALDTDNFALEAERVLALAIPPQYFEVEPSVASTDNQGQYGQITPTVERPEIHLEDEFSAIVSFGDTEGQHRLSGNSSNVTSIELSRSGRQVAAGTGNVAANDVLYSALNVVYVWNLDTGQLTQRLTGHEAPVIAVSWSPNDDRIVSLGLDNTIRLWDIAEGLEIYRYFLDVTGVTNMTWSSIDDVLRIDIGETERYFRVWQDSSQLIAIAEQCCISRIISNDELVQLGLPTLSPTPVGQMTKQCVDSAVYHTDMTGDWEIFRLGDLRGKPNADSNLSQGVGENVVDVSPSRSPDGQWIVFSSNRDGNWELYIAKVDGTEQRRVTFNNFATDTGAMWSPLGDKIVFSSNRDGNWNLFLLDLATGTETRITENPSNEIAPAFSIDAERVFLQSDRDGLWQIYEVNLSTLEQTRLSDGTGNDFDPLPSPNGDYVGFHSIREGLNSRVYIMDADGANPTPVSQPGEDARNLSWSSDQSLLAYNSNLDGDQDIYVFELASGETRQLTDNTTNDVAPTWLCSAPTILWTSNATLDKATEADVDDIYSITVLPMSAGPINVARDAIRLTNNGHDNRYPQNFPSVEFGSRASQQPPALRGR